MTFFQRFGYFAFGLGMGCILVYILLIRNREFPAWTPEGRVLEELTMDTIFISPDLNFQITDSVLRSKVKHSEVLFRESIVRNKPCREYQLDSKQERMRVSICDSIRTLVQYEPK